MADEYPRLDPDEIQYGYGRSRSDWGEGGRNTAAGESGDEDSIFDPLAIFWKQQFDNESKPEGFLELANIFANRDLFAKSHLSMEEALSITNEGKSALRALRVYEKSTGNKLPFKLSEPLTSLHLQFIKNAFNKLLR